MFTWICPKCGREVPPAYDECPNCCPKPAQTAAAPPITAADPAPPPAQVVAPPPPPPREPAPQPYVAPAAPAPPEPQPQPVFAQPPVPRPRSAAAALPTWLLAIAFTLAFLGLILGIYWLVGAMHGHGQPASSGAVATSPAPAAPSGGQEHPYQRYIEIAGLRFAEDPKNKTQIVAQYIVVNHSGALMNGLAGTATVWSKTSSGGQDLIGTFTFKTDLKGLESKELSAPLDTKFKIYELPDYPNAVATVLVTGPGGFVPGSVGPQ